MDQQREYSGRPAAHRLRRPAAQVRSRPPARPPLPVRWRAKCALGVGGSACWGPARRPGPEGISNALWPPTFQILSTPRPIPSHTTIIILLVPTSSAHAAGMPWPLNPLNLHPFPNNFPHPRRIADIRRLYGRDTSADDTIDFECDERQPPQGHVVAVRITAGACVLVRGRAWRLQPGEWARCKPPAPAPHISSHPLSPAATPPAAQEILIPFYMYPPLLPPDPCQRMPTAGSSPPAACGVPSAF